MVYIIARVAQQVETASEDIITALLQYFWKVKLSKKSTITRRAGDRRPEP
jgi:hypothetical protein